MKLEILALSVAISVFSIWNPAAAEDCEKAVGDKDVPQELRGCWRILKTAEFSKELDTKDYVFSKLENLQGEWGKKREFEIRFKDKELKGRKFKQASKITMHLVERGSAYEKLPTKWTGTSASFLEYAQQMITSGHSYFIGTGYLSDEPVMAFYTASKLQERTQCALLGPPTPLECRQFALIIVKVTHFGTASQFISAKGDGTHPAQGGVIHGVGR